MATTRAPAAKRVAPVAPARRADAERNRAHVLEVAQVVFAAEGIGVPIDDIARRAGVGVGTIYRHFPTKASLFAAIIHARMARLAADAKANARAADPGAAFFAFLDAMWREGGHKKDLADALRGTDFELTRPTAAGPVTDLRRALATLLRRAQAARAVRAGVTVGELLALMSATLTAAARESGARDRLFAIVRDGLRVPHA